MTNSIVSVQWLHENLKNPDLIILDATLSPKKEKLPPSLKGIQIKGARYFDIKNKFSNLNDPFPSAFPSRELFQKECRILGINTSSTIVVYDANGIYSSPRAWLLFKAMGHKNIAVLNGGLPEWLSHKFATEKSKSENYAIGNFEATLSKKRVRNFDDIHQNLKTKKELVIDVRSELRFKSLVPEPREGLRSGTIPNSINLPYTEFLENGKYKSASAIKKLFEPLNKEKRTLVFSCGSGITACVVLLATETLIGNDMTIYDGSWTEWGEKFQ